MIEIVFALAPGQNHFFVEIVDALRTELMDLGVRSSTTTGPLPEPREDAVVVLVPPHEYFALTPSERHPAPPELLRAIFLCAEQPGTWFFDENVRLAHLHGAALFDVSALGVHAFRRAGLRAEHLPLGFSRAWACSRDEVDAERDVDVAHLGIWSRRRAEALARCAPVLARRRSQLILSDPEHANVDPTPNFMIEDDKWALLRRARTLLNIHVAERPYFEWQRIVQAISNGAAVVTEHSEGVLPLNPGEHFIPSSIERLPVVLARVLDDEEGRRLMAQRAYEYLRDELPLRRSAERLAAVAAERAKLPLPPSRPPAPRSPESRPPEREPIRFPSQVDDPQLAALRAALKDIRLELLAQRRELHSLRETEPSLARVHESRGYATARPLVTVIVPMYNERTSVSEALASCTIQRMPDLEVVVVDDGSSDGSADAVAAWSAAHDTLPLLLLRHQVNRGLGPARNTALDHARAPFTFVLDADNAMFATTLERLLDALDRNPHAAFAYSMLAMEANGEPVGLRSAFPWNPERLRTGNYIDAMALWRTASLHEFGGYTTDLRLYGWEDYDLLCRVAERGGSGVLVPEILGRYQVRGHSMLSVTDISTRAAVSLLIERHPKLMQGVEPPL